MEPVAFLPGSSQAMSVTSAGTVAKRLCDSWISIAFSFVPLEFGNVKGFSLGPARPYRETAPGL